MHKIKKNREGRLVWPNYVFSVIRRQVFIVITPHFSPFSVVFSNQGLKMQLCCGCWIFNPTSLPFCSNIVRTVTKHRL